MISLRKYIDNYRADARKPSVDGQDIPEPVLSEFHAMLLAIGQCADQAAPGLSVELNPKMTCLQQALAPPVSIDLLIETSRQARTELSQWADRALMHNRNVERELREIISVVSSAAKSLSDRDAKYAREIGDLTGRLTSIAEENDLASMRCSIIESTSALKECVERMVEDSKASVDHLTAEVQEYRVRLKEAERASQIDPLTNLANRGALEKHMEERVAAREPFCLIMIDLNDFKGVNDRFGHIAGDDLLKQFAQELKWQFTSAELVCRWGGDEFVVLISGHRGEAHARVECVRKWSLGEYKITRGDGEVEIQLNAAIGVAEWDGNESALQLFARADQEVYRAKQAGEFTGALNGKGIH